MITSITEPCAIAARYAGAGPSKPSVASPYVHCASGEIPAKNTDPAEDHAFQYG